MLPVAGSEFGNLVEMGGVCAGAPLRRVLGAAPVTPETTPTSPACVTTVLFRRDAAVRHPIVFLAADGLGPPVAQRKRRSQRHRLAYFGLFGEMPQYDTRFSFLAELWTAEDFSGMRLQPLPFAPSDVELINAGLAI